MHGSSSSSSSLFRNTIDAIENIVDCVPRIHQESDNTIHTNKRNIMITDDIHETLTSSSALVQYIQVLCMIITKKNNNVIYYCICLLHVITYLKCTVCKAF